MVPKTIRTRDDPSRMAAIPSRFEQTPVVSVNSFVDGATGAAQGGQVLIAGSTTAVMLSRGRDCLKVS